MHSAGSRFFTNIMAGIALESSFVVINSMCALPQLLVYTESPTNYGDMDIEELYCMYACICLTVNNCSSANNRFSIIKNWMNPTVMIYIYTYIVQCPSLKCLPRFYSPVNNVPPQWILSPLKQGWELSSAGIQALLGGKMSSFLKQASNLEWLHRPTRLWSMRTELCVQRSWRTLNLCIDNVVEWFMRSVS